MQPGVLLLTYLANVALLSLALALVEIVMEKGNGWGSGLNQRTWGRKLWQGSLIARLCEKQYVTLYHAVMFAMALPAVFITEYLVAVRIGVVQGSWLRGALFVAASWLLLCVLEDALWFALNWYYPGSWRDLIAGRIWWHTRWWRFGRIHLPGFYVWGLALSAVAMAMAVWRP